MFDKQCCTHRYFLSSQPFVKLALAMLVYIVCYISYQLVHLIQCVHFAVKRRYLKQSEHSKFVTSPLVGTTLTKIQQDLIVHAIHITNHLKLYYIQDTNFKQAESYKIFKFFCYSQYHQLIIMHFFTF